MNLFKKVDEDDETEFTTYPRTFENYKWYKPIIIGILGVILYIVLSIALIGIILGFNSFDFQILNQLLSESATNDNMDTILSLVIIALLIPSFYIPSKLIHKIPLSSIGRWRWGVFLKTTAISLLVYGVITIIQIIAEGLSFNNTFTILTFILCLIMTPFQCFAEEYICRGFLMQTFGSWFRIPIVAIILQAVIFTVLHEYNIIGLIDILISGITFGLITWYTKGLELSTALHTTNNIITFLVFGFGFAASTTIVPISDVVISLATLFISVGLIIFIDKKYNWIGLNEHR